MPRSQHGGTGQEILPKPPTSIEGDDETLYYLYTFQSSVTSLGKPSWVDPADPK